jgi:hypothetical protein
MVGLTMRTMENSILHGTVKLLWNDFEYWESPDGCGGSFSPHKIVAVFKLGKFAAGVQFPLWALLVEFQKDDTHQFCRTVAKRPRGVPLGVPWP